MIGHLDVADNFRVAGWTRRDDSDGPEILDVLADGQRVARILACEHRADVGDHALTM